MVGLAQRKVQMKPGLGRNIEWGRLVNRLRKVQRRWDYWYPRCCHGTRILETGGQAIARAECEKLAPLLSDLKRRKADIESQYD